GSAATLITWAEGLNDRSDRLSVSDPTAMRWARKGLPSGTSSAVRPVSPAANERYWDSRAETTVPPRVLRPSRMRGVVTQTVSATNRRVDGWTVSAFGGAPVRWESARVESSPATGRERLSVWPSSRLGCG